MKDHDTQEMFVGTGVYDSCYICGYANKNQEVVNLTRNPKQVYIGNT